jgi:ribosomal protein S18 acetylase RimI-like enzyme
MNVDDDSRGQGYGSDLMDQFFSEVGEQAVEAIILFADLSESQEDGFDLVRFYEGYDFEVVKKYPDGVLMINSFR